MANIRINNWEKFQHYKDRRPTWIKLLIEIIEEFDADGNPKKFFYLPDCAKKTFPYLICLRANYNDKIPYPNDKWLKKRLGLRSISLQPLADAGFITIDTESVSEPYQGGTECAHQRERESKSKRTEKEKHLDFVFLTSEEHKKLLQRYGDMNTRKLIDSLNRYIGSTGKKYKSHYFTLLNFAKRDGMPELKPSKETAESEQQALEKTRRKIRGEYWDVYNEKEWDELVKMREDKKYITHWWLIDEVLKLEAKRYDMPTG